MYITIVKRCRTEKTKALDEYGLNPYAKERVTTLGNRMQVGLAVGVLLKSAMVSNKCEEDGVAFSKYIVNGENRDVRKSNVCNYTM